MTHTPLATLLGTTIALGAAALLVTARVARAQGQPLDQDSSLTVILKDGTTVRLLREAAGIGVTAKSHVFYYLPTNLRLSRRPDGNPEFLFLKYTTEDDPSTGGIQGGLLHFLMEWGLTADQEKELEQKVAAMEPGATVRGAAQVAPAGDNASFKIISATLSSTGRTRTLLFGKAPLVAGSKVAVAADLDRYGAQLLAATFEKARTITDVSIELDLTYPALVPAAQGVITVNWSKLARSYDSLGATYSRTHTSDATSQSCLWIICASSSTPQYSYSYDEVRRQYDFLVEHHVVDFQWEETVNDERIAKVRDAFFQFLLNAMAKPADNSVPPAPTDTTGTPDVQKGDRYVFRRVRSRESQEIHDETYRMNMRLTFNVPISVTGNLASWYDGVRDNPLAVASVNLNNPFYDHYTVPFKVDFDAPQELFSSVINYVTISLRKQRSQGNPYEKSVTIDANYIKDHGEVAQFTYARGDDDHPADFEYSYQFSWKGGKLFPLTQTWQPSNGITAVTLTPPVKPVTIQLEGDLADLKAANITRVTAQVHYRQFGQEVEENVQLPVLGQEPLVSKTIFMDRDAKGYVYRLVVNHKTEGKLALDWSAMVGDDYIYAQIPPTLLSDADLKAAAKTAAQAAVTGAVTNVLDRFQNVLGGTKP